MILQECFPVPFEFHLSNDVSARFRIRLSCSFIYIYHFLTWNDQHNPFMIKATPHHHWLFMRFTKHDNTYCI